MTAVEPHRVIPPWSVIRFLLLMLEQEKELNFFPCKQPVTTRSAHVAAIITILGTPMISLDQILAKGTC